MFSNNISGAFDAIQKLDPYVWVNFEFYPCPVGADTPAGCTADPGPFPGVNPNCCLNDKFEACMVSQLQCLPGSTTCPPELSAKMAHFLGCLEGGLISEGQCPGSPQACAATANLTDYYPAISACYNSPHAAKKASLFMNQTCTAEAPKSWPHVRINGVLMCEDDSCFMPLLPYLCDGACPPLAACRACCRLTRAVYAGA